MNYIHHIQAFSLERTPKFLFILFILISVLSCSFSCTQAAPIEIDQWIKADLSNEETYGAVIAIMKDGRIQHLSGYGSADKEGEWPLDPKTTRIPIGSITKLFTWEALEQLIHDGHIEPDADLNNYLPSPFLRSSSYFSFLDLSEYQVCYMVHPCSSVLSSCSPSSLLV